MLHQSLSTPTADDGQPLSSVYDNHDRDQDRGHYFLAAVCLILAAGIGTAIWYEYPVLVTHKADLLRLPSLAQNVDFISDHLRQTDAQVANWSREQNAQREAIESQMTTLQRDLRSRVASARKQLSDAADAAYARIEARVSEQIDGIQTRLANIESDRDADQKRVSALQQELATMRQDMSQQSDRIAALQHQMDQNGADTGSQIASIEQERVRDRHDVDTIQSQLAVDKIPFEAPKGQDRELASGISLHISKTNVSRGEFDGWVALKPGQRSIQLHHQSAAEPLIFYAPQSHGRGELVITGLDRNSVSGYLVLPKASASPADAVQ